MLDLGCTTEQKIRVTVNPVTAAGNPAQLDGSVSVGVQSGNGTVEMVDARTFFVVSGADPGDTSFLVEADADMGPGVQTLQDVIVLHVAGALAANLGMTADAPVPK